MNALLIYFIIFSTSLVDKGKVQQSNDNSALGGGGGQEGMLYIWSQLVRNRNVLSQDFESIQ